MEYKRFGNTLVVRLDPGDEVAACVQQVCRDEKVQLATVSGFGAVSRIKVGAFHPDTREYSSEEFSADFEIVSMLGNITVMDGEPYLHCHLAAAYAGEAVVVGGHLFEAEVSATVEVFITQLDGVVERRFNEAIGTGTMVF